MTSHFPGQFAMRSWQKVWQRSTIWVPNSGWITFHVRSEAELKHALWLMGLSYLRYALKISTDPDRLLEQETERLHLSRQFRSLLDAFVPKTANHAATEHLSV